MFFFFVFFILLYLICIYLILYLFFLLFSFYILYHRRRVVSRSCSGWEGVGPTRYGHQAKRDVLLGRPTEPIWEEAVILGCVYRTRESTRSGKADLL